MKLSSEGAVNNMDICVCTGCQQHFHLAHKGSVTVAVNGKQEITVSLSVPR